MACALDASETVLYFAAPRSDLVAERAEGPKHVGVLLAVSGFRLLDGPRETCVGLLVRLLRLLEALAVGRFRAVDRELSGEIGRLQRAVPRPLAQDRRDEPPPRGGKVPLPRTTDRDERNLTDLETAFYCDDADRNLDYDPRRPDAWSAFLLNEEGRQRVCLSEPGRARPARTPALDLRFWNYFAQTQERCGVRGRGPLPRGRSAAASATRRTRSR